MRAHRPMSAAMQALRLERGLPKVWAGDDWFSIYDFPCGSLLPVWPPRPSDARFDKIFEIAASLPEGFALLVDPDRDRTWLMKQRDRGVLRFEKIVNTNTIRTSIEQIECEKSEILRDQMVELSAFFGLPEFPFGVLPDGGVLGIVRVIAGHELDPIGCVATPMVMDGGGIDNDPVAKSPVAA